MMEPFVVKVDEFQLDELRVALMDLDKTHEHRTTNQYEAFRFYFAGGLIVGYTSGKVVANSPETARLLQQVMGQLEYHGGEGITIGSDEAGKGEWLGPLTIAAVALNAEQERYLRSVGVMDSKDLSAASIGELAYEIEENSLDIHVITIPPKTFEERMDDLHSEGKTLNDLLAWAHAEAISKVYSKVSRTREIIHVIVDEFDEKKMQERLFRKLDLQKIELSQEHGAEKYTAVAAASIMARDARDEWIDKASLRLGVELLGMSSAEARDRSDLEEFAKVSYMKSKKR